MVRTINGKFPLIYRLSITATTTTLKVAWSRYGETSPVKSILDLR